MENKCCACRNVDIQILSHHIYEYRKGIRNLVLHTMGSSQRDEVEKILMQKNIDYIIQEVNSNKINVFFGSRECVDIIKSFGNQPLFNYTPEQDFILGIMLGYGRQQQFERYLEMKSKMNKTQLFSIA